MKDQPPLQNPTMVDRDFEVKRGRGMGRERGGSAASCGIRLLPGFAPRLTDDVSIVSDGGTGRFFDADFPMHAFSDRFQPANKWPLAANRNTSLSLSVRSSGLSSRTAPAASAGASQPSSSPTPTAPARPSPTSMVFSSTTVPSRYFFPSSSRVSREQKS